MLVIDWVNRRIVMSSFFCVEFLLLRIYGLSTLYISLDTIIYSRHGWYANTYISPILWSMHTKYISHREVPMVGIIG